MKAQKKPVIIDYLEWDGNSDSLQFWMDEFKEKIDDHFILEMNQFEGDDLKVKTLEGTSYDVPEGYILIRGIKGEFYPCAKDIFEQTYDLI